MPNDQTRIDIEIEAVKQIASIHVYGGITVKQSDTHVVEAYKWLVRRKYLLVSGRRFVITDAGKDWYESAFQNPKIRANIQKWKDEVLTGMDHKGDETKIQNPAIPKPSKPQYNNERELLEHYRTSLTARIELAQSLGMSLNKLLSHASDGSLRVCNHGTPHLGIFHRSHKRASGWQSWCSGCRKDKRDERARAAAEGGK